MSADRLGLLLRGIPPSLGHIPRIEFGEDDVQALLTLIEPVKYGLGR